ncbi:MAG TPA: tetratricopeptide repeat protein, partial [Ferruginibacter sp.]|nr:tetratricopeptide repeat protein [Ferruginibacter sp.]
NLKQVRAAWPDYAKVYFELGYAFEQLERLDSAVAQYEKCLVINPKYSGVYKRLATMAYNKEDYPKALEHYRKAVEVSADEINDYLFWYRKGFCENNGQEYEKALESLRKAKEQNRKYTSTYLEIGFANSKLKRNDSAMAAFQQAIELEPNSHIGYNGIAEIYRDNLKDYETAMTWYRKTLAINSKERKANYGMGYCLNSQSKSADAIPYLKQALQSEPSYTAAMTELGYAYYKTASYADALSVLKKAIGINPKSQNTYYYLTLTYIALKDKSNAQKQVDALRDIGAANYADQLQKKVNEMN